MRGYLADGCAGPRDFMNGRIVISHRYILLIIKPKTNSG